MAKIKNYIFITLGIGVIIIIIFNANLRQLVSILKNTSLTLLTIGFIVSMIPTILNSVKWKLLLDKKEIKIPFPTIFANQLIGLFVSSFLPSKYSGDAYKTYLVANYSGRGYDTIASVVLQRLSGLLVLSLTCIVGGIFCAFHFKMYQLTLTVIVVCMLIISGIGIIFTRKAFNIIGRILRFFRLDIIRKHIIKFHESMIDYRLEWRLIFKILGLSVLFYVTAFLTVYIICLAIGSRVPFIYIVFIMPVIYLLEALPISVNGIGIREGALVYSTQIGLQIEQAFAISLIILFYRLIKALMGGACFLLSHSNSRWLNLNANNKAISVTDCANNSIHYS